MTYPTPAILDREERDLRQGRERWKSSHAQTQIMAAKEGRDEAQGKKLPNTD